jgi:type I restriction enzyme S subunit
MLNKDMNWKEIELEQVGDIVTGKTPSTKDVDNFGKIYPFITPKDMTGQKYIFETERYLSDKGMKAVKNCLINKNTVCVSCIGSDMGKVVMATKPSVTNQQLNSIKVNNKYNSDFIFYSLHLISEDLRNAAFHSTAVPILNKTQFSKFKIMAPPLPEQRAIAEILSSIDDKIELNNQMNRTLEATAQAIFKQWFVNYEFPTSINEGLEPFVNRSGGRMVDSELGPIPEGWRVGTISSVSSFISRGVSPQYSDDHGDLVINQRCIRDRKVSLANARRNTKKIMSEKYIQFGDVLINSTGMGTLGRVAQVYEKIDLCTADSHVTIARPSSNINYNYYGMLLLNLEEYFESQGAGSTGQTELNKRVVEDKLVIIPDSGITEIFSERIEAIRNRILSNDKESQTLSTLRDSLLPKLMSGELRVPEEIVKGFEDMGCDA